MKILFTADLHIKLGQKKVPIEWQINRYNMLFNKLEELSKKCSMVVIGGDIFDRLPTMEELDLYFKLVSKLKNVKTIIYSGNHEAVKKNTTFLTSLKPITALASDNNISIVDEFYTIDNIDFIPYNRLKMYHPADIDFHGDILFTHVRGEIPPHVKPEVPLTLFERWKLVLAGDLHSHSNSQLNIVYPGSPVTTSFHRELTTTGVVILDSSSLEWEFCKLDLPQLLRKTVTSPKEMVATDFHHTIYELEGDLAELSTSKNTNNELFDKKVVKRASTATLELNNSMTLNQELDLYFSEILQLPKNTIKDLLHLLDDYIKTANLE